jgi:hypothetical protein
VKNRCYELTIEQVHVLPLGGRRVAVALHVREYGGGDAAFDHDRGEGLAEVVEGDPRLTFADQAGFFCGGLEAALGTLRCSSGWPVAEEHRLFVSEWWKGCADPLDHDHAPTRARARGKAC